MSEIAPEKFSSLPSTMETSDLPALHKALAQLQSAGVRGLALDAAISVEVDRLQYERDPLNVLLQCRYRCMEECLRRESPQVFTYLYDVVWLPNEEHE